LPFVFEQLQNAGMLTRRVIGRLITGSRTILTQPSRKLAVAATQTPSTNDPFANGTNAYYADEMYRLWKQDPNSVHSSWNVYFTGLDKGLSSAQSFQPAPRSLPHPVDGAPALHVGQGAELDDHLKVR
jgi:2-oxoglutarate dehydrogenase E1 component